MAVPRKKKRPIIEDEAEFSHAPAPIYGVTPDGEQVDLASLGKDDEVLAEEDEQGRPVVLSGFAAEELRKVLVELASRQVEALKLYEPLPSQLAFHKSNAWERLLRGSNRGGKTLPATIEVIWLATGTHPYLPFPKKDARIFCVAKDERKLGEVIWRKMTKPGAFRIIRDLESGEWRAFRPATDWERKKESMPSPPLLPRRWIKHISWALKKDGIPKKVTLINGTEISFYSSKGAPPNGVDIDLAWFDEEIEVADWYSEICARLLDRATFEEGSGKFFWSATPQAGAEQLWELHLHCEDERKNPEPAAEEFFIALADNPFIGDREKKVLASKLTSEEERRVRIGGEFAFVSYRMYPEFSKDIHGVDPFPIPYNWTRIAAIDPGRSPCAVLFGAIPPPFPDHDSRLPAELFGDFCYLFDELYLFECTAALFAKEMAVKTERQQFHAFLIDHRSGRQPQIASGVTTEEQYSEELAELRVRSTISGSGFVWGSDDRMGGIQKVASWLAIRPDGTTKLRVFRGCLPNWEREIERYRKKKINGVITDQPVDRDDHLMDDTRYIAQYDQKWVPPPTRQKRRSGSLEALLAKQSRRRLQDMPFGRQTTTFGPSG